MFAGGVFEKYEDSDFVGERRGHADETRERAGRVVRHNFFCGRRVNCLFTWAWRFTTDLPRWRPDYIGAGEIARVAGARRRGSNSATRTSNYVTEVLVMKNLNRCGGSVLSHAFLYRHRGRSGFE